MIVPIRVWDTFVTDTNQFALGVAYAADNGIQIVEAALGGLTNTSFARAAMRDAYARGVFMAVVSLRPQHRRPQLPDHLRRGDDGRRHGRRRAGAGQPATRRSARFLGDLGIPTSAPIATWFRNSGTTQYGGHGHIVMPAVTGSAATGQAAGAAGLVASYGLRARLRRSPRTRSSSCSRSPPRTSCRRTPSAPARPTPRSPAGTSTSATGGPTSASRSSASRQGRIPPQALITGPDWFEPLALERQPHRRHRAAACPPAAAALTYRVEWAPGHRAARERVPPRRRRQRRARTGALATIDLAAVRAALDARPGGGAANDPTAPAKGPGDADPNEPAFTVRVRATDAAGTRGEDRKVLFAYRDRTLAPGLAALARRRRRGLPAPLGRRRRQPARRRAGRVQRHAERARPATGRPLPGFPVRTRHARPACTPARPSTRASRRRASRCARRRSATSTATAGRDRRHRGRARLRLGARRRRRSPASRCA